MLIDKKIKLSKRKIKRLNWGIAGAGRIAENEFLPALLQVKRSRLISIYSHDLERAKKLSSTFGGDSAFDDYKLFLKTPIDAVYISSANSDHHWQTIEAAKAGKHVLCEKPIALNSLQAEEMVKVCEQNNVQLALNFNHRFNPLVVKAKELIRSGLVGKIVSIRTSYNISVPPSNNFRFKIEKSGGGASRDLGTSLVDLLQFLGGEIVNISGVIDNLIYKSDVDDFASALVKFKKSGYGFFNVSYNTEKAFNRIEILGHKGSLCLENIFAGRNKTTTLTIDIVGETKKSFRRRVNKMTYVVKSVQNSFLKNELPDSSGSDGLKNLQLIEQLERENKS